MGGSRGGGVGRGSDLPWKITKKLGFHINSGPDPLKKHKATKPAFNVGPPPAHQRNAILMAFRWWADDGPSIPPSTNKTLSSLDPLWQNFLDPRMLAITLSSADDPCKQFGPRSGPKECRSRSDSKPLSSLVVFLNDLKKKERKSQETTTKAWTRIQHSTS